MEKLTIKKGQLTDLDELQQLYVDTIKNTCRRDYNSQQIDVWASGIENKQRWHGVMTKQLVLVAESEGKIVGFCTLDCGTYIDLLYVHKDHQGQGIAFKLYSEIEAEARRQGQPVLTSNVSKTARPFFERLGFSVVSEQVVILKAVELVNFKMRKLLTDR